MRLTDFEQETIKSSILRYDDRAEIFIFGSRVNDQAKGGDIDVLVLSQKIQNTQKKDILNHIFTDLEEQKIDIIIEPDNASPFVQLAIQEGIKIN